MKWMTIIAVLVSFAFTPNSASAERLSHTGVPCKTRQILKKEHPTSHILWENVGGKRCYHVHVQTRIRPSVNTWAIPKGAPTVINHPYIAEYRVTIDDIHARYGPRQLNSLRTP